MDVAIGDVNQQATENCRQRRVVKEKDSNTRLAHHRRKKAVGKAVPSRKWHGTSVPRYQPGARQPDPAGCTLSAVFSLALGPQRSQTFDIVFAVGLGFRPNRHGRLARKGSNDREQKRRYQYAEPDRVKTNPEQVCWDWRCLLRHRRHFLEPVE